MFSFIRRSKSYGLVLGVIVLGQVQSPKALAQTPAKSEIKVPGKDQTAYLEIFKPAIKQIAPATVKILCLGKEVALGTVVDPSGLVVTKASEVKYLPRIRLKDGREFKAELIGIEEQHDLMMLKIPSDGITAVSFPSMPTDLSTAGKWVVSTGLGDNPLSVGVVSVAPRFFDEKQLPRLPKSSATGFLGVTAGESGEDEGVRIDGMEPGGSAEKSGLKVGDIVLAIKGKKVNAPEELINVMQTTKPGDVVVVTYKRENKITDLRILLGKRPSMNQRGDIQNRMGGELSERRTAFPAILQHDSILKPNECGGPICDINGNCLGINIARAGRVESYALPIDTIVKMIPDFKSGKYAWEGPLPGEIAIQEKVKSLQDTIKEATAARKEAESKVKESQKSLDIAEKARRDAEQKLKEAEDLLKKTKQEADQVEKAREEKK